MHDVAIGKSAQRLYFHPRCQYCIDICKTEPPQLREIAPEHFVSCHRAEELNLSGVKEITLAASEV
jgi:peptide/nickel transport system ATP-binding protein